MNIVDEIFRDFKEFGYLEDLKKMDSKSEIFEKIREIVSKVNVFKAEIQDLTIDEQLYLDYKLQQEGINLELCSLFYIFFSNKNIRFHYICKKDNTRAFCKGNCKKCHNDTINESGN
ncbi:MAG: hypothetical protein KJ674_05575 [Nanoarchaeota archaeon]|nr:hypothetical protein [Nanoarchaeota archaeon]